MAKVSFTKLGLKLNQETKPIEWNEQIIEIKQYLPLEKKLELISEVINSSVDDNNFANPIRINTWLMIEIIENYTNISFTEKQKENVCKLYDLFNSTGLLKQIIDNIPKDEYDELYDGTFKSAKAIYKYRNSILGILDTMKEDYSDLSLDATKIKEDLADPDNMGLLKQILTQLG